MPDACDVRPLSLRRLPAAPDSERIQESIRKHNAKLQLLQAISNSYPKKSSMIKK